MRTIQANDLLTFWIDALNRGHVDAADDVFTPDCVVHVTGFAPIEGVEAWKQTIGGFIAAFPDIQFTVEEQIVADDRVVTRWHARATHRGHFGPIPPTGRRISVDGLMIDHLRDGRIAQRWEQFDYAAIVQQLS